jgi:hypothetical protein
VPEPRREADVDVVLRDEWVTVFGYLTGPGALHEMIFIPEQIVNRATGEEIDYFAEITDREWDWIDEAFWDAHDDLADEDYPGPDYDDDDPEEWPGNDEEES